MAHLETPSGTQDIHNREKESVSTLLPVQLRKNSAVFISFLEDYYEFTNKVDEPTNLIDRISNEHDVDFTSDKFLNEIKKEIARGIPESQVLNNRQLFKKIVDYYYTRGSENSADVFFKLFFNDEVTITYPKETLFKTSDSTLNNHGFVDLQGTGERVQWSNITGDFVKPLTPIPVGGKKAVFISSTTGAVDWMRGTYVYDANTKRWNHVQEGNDRQFFVYNTGETRWEFVRQLTNFYWGFDDGDVRATDEEGFWSVMGGQTDRWKVIAGGNSFSNPQYPVTTYAAYSTNAIPGLPQNFTAANYPDIRNFNPAGGSLPNLNTTNSTAFDNVTTRGNTPIQEVVLEDNRHVNEYYVHYGESEHDFWQVDNDSILRSDEQDDNIGESIELNTRHIYAEENFIKYPLYDYAYTSANYNDSITYVDAYSIRVEQTTGYLPNSGRSNEVTIPLGTCGIEGETFKLSGTVHVLSSGGATRQLSQTYESAVFLSSNSKGWEQSTESITEDEQILRPLNTSTGQRGFDIISGSGVTGDFELILTRSNKEYFQSTVDRDGSGEAELTFVSIYGTDFKLSNLRLEKCRSSFTRIGVNNFSFFQVGDVINTDNGGSNFAASTFASGSTETGTDKGMPSGTIIALQDFGTNQQFIDVQPTVVKGTITTSGTGVSTITVTNPNYSASTPTGFPGGLIEPGMYIVSEGISYIGNQIRVKDVTFDQTGQTISVTLGIGTGNTTASDLVGGFNVTAGKEITFKSRTPFLQGSAYSCLSSRNGGVVRSARTIQDNGFEMSDDVIFHKDYNRNKQLNSFWYTGNANRSETQLRAHVYDAPGVDPDGQTFYARVPVGVTNSKKLVVVDYENLPRKGMWLEPGYKPNGRFNNLQHGFPYQIAPEGGQSYLSYMSYVAVTGNVITDEIASLTFNGNVYTYGTGTEGDQTYIEFKRTISGGFESFKKTNHGSTAIADGAAEGSWNPGLFSSGGSTSSNYTGRFSSLPALLGTGPFPTHQTDTSLFTIQYTTPASKTGTEFLLDGMGSNQVVLKGMYVSGTGITHGSDYKGVRVTAVEHDDSIITGAIKITLDTSVTLSNNTRLNFHNASTDGDNTITDVTFKRPTFGKVTTTATATPSYTSGEITFNITVNSGGVPPIGTVVQGKRIKRGSYVKAVSNQSTDGSGNITCDITLSDQCSTVGLLKSTPSGDQKTLRIQWVRGEKPDNSNWQGNNQKKMYMYKTAEGSLHKRNIDDGGQTPVNGLSKVTAVTPVAGSYNQFDITFDTAQPYLVNGDYVNFKNFGSYANIQANTQLQFSLCEITTSVNTSIYSDGGWINMHYRGIRPGGHYYPSGHRLPFFDNRNDSQILPGTTDLIELGTYEGNTHIYGKDKDDNIFTVQQPRQYPHRTNNPKIPTDTLVFSDKHFALAGKGKDAFVLPLNMYGKDFMGLETASSLSQFYGYALEDCTIRYFLLEQHREGTRIGDEHTMQEEISLLGPKAQETNVLLTRQLNVSYFYGRDSQTYYEVKVSGDYSPYIDDDEESIILRNGQTLNYRESKNLLVGDIFTPKITEAGSIFLSDGLKVKPAPTEIKHVKAGDKFTFTGNRHYARAEDGFYESNRLTNSHGRYYISLFECSGRCVIAQSMEAQTEQKMILAPASEKTLGFRRSGGSFGPFTQSGREGWYFADHGRLGWNGIAIEKAEVIHDYGQDEHTMTMAASRHYLQTRGAVTNSTTYEYDNTTLGFEDHAESLVPGLYCEIAYGLSKGSQTGTTIELDGLRGTITPGLEIQIQTGKFTTIGNPGTAVTVVSVASNPAPNFTGNSRSGTATITLSDTIEGLDDNAQVGFYAKVANTPTRVGYASKRIPSKPSFFDRNVTMIDNFTLYIGPNMGGDVTSLACTNQNAFNNISVLRSYSSTYQAEGMKFTFPDGTERTSIRQGETEKAYLDGKFSAKHGDTVTAKMPDFPAVIKLQTPLSHEIYWGKTSKLGRLKNLGYSGNYDPNDVDLNVLIGQDGDDIYIPAFAVGYVNGATTSSTSISIDGHFHAQDPTGDLYDNGMDYASPHNEDSKKYPSYSQVYAKVKVGMEVSGTGIDNSTVQTVVTAVTNQNSITVNKPLTLSDNVKLTFRAPETIPFSTGMEVSGTGVTTGTKISSVTSQSGFTSAVLVLDTVVTVNDNVTLTFTLNGCTITASVNGTTFNNVNSITVDNITKVQYSNIDVARITSIGQTPPAHLEFIGIQHSVDKGSAYGHYDESIGDPLYHIHTNDSRGNDSFMSLPLEKLKDTYVVPHSITDWCATTIYTNQWNIYFWKAGWVKYGNTVNRPFARQGVSQIQNFPTGVTFGTSTTLLTDPNDTSYTPTLWKFEGIRPFFLVTNDGDADEEAVYGFNRNTYPKENYKFFSDYADRKGRISDVNKLHDGNFNQEFSYGINTTLSLDKWETKYRKLVHPSGTKFFGLLNIEGSVNDTDAKRTFATHHSGSKKYELTIGQGIDWLKNLKLGFGQHTPKYQPGWLDQVLTSLVEIEPLITAGVKLPSSVVDTIEQLLNSTYRFTLQKQNGMTDLKLRTTFVETTTPVTIDTVDLPTFVRPVHITSRDIEKSGLVNTSGSTRKKINKIINPDRHDSRTGTTAVPFNIRNLKSNSGPTSLTYVDNQDQNQHDIQIELQNAIASDDRIYQLRLYGLQSGTKYKVSGKVAVITNTSNASSTVQVGVDISDGYVQENEAARAAGTYSHPNNSTGPGVADIRVNPGQTLSFTSFEATGTYWHFANRPTIGRNNIPGTHDFIDINARIHHNPSNGNFNGRVVVVYRDLKIEEYYMANESVYSNTFDTRIDGISDNSDLMRVGTIPATPKEDSKTLFTSWHNPISNLQNISNTNRPGIYGVTPLNVPYNTALRAKISGGGQPTPIIGNTTSLSTSRFEASENITDGTSTTAISKVTDISRLGLSNNRVTRLTVSDTTGFTSGETITGGTSQATGIIRNVPDSVTLEIEETLGVRTLDFTFN